MAEEGWCLDTHWVAGKASGKQVGYLHPGTTYEGFYQDGVLEGPRRYWNSEGYVFNEFTLQMAFWVLF